MASRFTFEGISVDCANRNFRAEQISGADLHTSRTQRQRRHHPACVGNTASSNDRRLHRLYDLGNQGRKYPLVWSNQPVKT